MKDSGTVGGRSVRRALAILRVLAEDGRGLRVTDIAERSGLAKGTVHLLLKVLEEEGFVEQDRVTRRYRLGPEAQRLGMALMRGRDLRQVARASLERLCDRAGMPAYLATLVGDQAVLIEKVEPLAPLVAVLPVGTQVPFHSSALGKVLAVYMPADRREVLLGTWGTPAFTGNTITDPDEVMREWERVRQAGVATDDEESLPGVCCLAAPVRDGSGAVVAAVSIAGPAHRVRERRDYLRSLVEEVAGEISRDLGYRGGADVEEG